MGETRTSRARGYKDHLSLNHGFRFPLTNGTLNASTTFTTQTALAINQQDFNCTPTQRQSCETKRRYLKEPFFDTSKALVPSSTHVTNPLRITHDLTFIHHPSLPQTPYFYTGSRERNNPPSRLPSDASRVLALKSRDAAHHAEESHNNEEGVPTRRTNKSRRIVEHSSTPLISRGKGYQYQMSSR